MCRRLVFFVALCLSLTAATPPLSPLLSQKQSVKWWFLFKFNSETFQGCPGTAQPVCTFGGKVQKYTHFGQQFAFASSELPSLRQGGGGCAGDTTSDPLGATFAQVYNGKYFYVLWNDQFYGDPIASQASPHGHSKGMLAWDKNGAGLVLQVSTPSWPAAGSMSAPRKTDGNTLGCVKDNDVLVSQHFFALQLTKDDVVAVLNGLTNSSVVTDPTVKQIVNNGGPADIQALVAGLGKISKSKAVVQTKLSSGVTMISKPSGLPVPPWQMVSAQLKGEPLRVASWWTRPEIPSTTASTPVGCWDDSLGKPGPVEIATTGTWTAATDSSIGLTGMAEPDGNHAKIGVSIGEHPKYAIFGDLNQQGALTGNCKSSQNGRGGLFYVVEDPKLAETVQQLLAGKSDK
jgi:hypothetical protein